MKKRILEFFHRGLVACGFGPLVFAVIFLFLQKHGVADTITVREMCLGIFTSAALAFVAGGANMLYTLERLPLALAILIHGLVLYVSYLLVYLVNGWLEFRSPPIMIFTLIFAGGYLIIWGFIYLTVKKRADNLNRMLKENQAHAEEPLR